MRGAPVGPLLPPPPSSPQEGGSPDLDALWAELREWPGWYVTSITPSTLWATHGPDRVTGPEAWRSTSCSSWCVTAEPDGWDKQRARVLQWAPSIREAADMMAEWMRDVRQSDHAALSIAHSLEVHQDWSIYIPACDACRGEADFDGVDIDDEDDR